MRDSGKKVPGQRLAMLSCAKGVAITERKEAGEEVEGGQSYLFQGVVHRLPRFIVNRALFLLDAPGLKDIILLVLLKCGCQDEHSNLPSERAISLSFG